MSDTALTDDAANTPEASTPQEINSLNLLLFRVGEVSFGVDADQVSEITAYNGEKAEGLLWFHEEIGYGDKTVEYNSPTVITIGTDEVSPYRIIIDGLENITEFSSYDIKPFPSLLEPFVLHNGIWGILPRNGNLFFLLDFTQLLRARGRSSH